LVNQYFKHESPLTRKTALGKDSRKIKEMGALALYSRVRAPIYF
jgi:hypothetical protein